MCVCGAVTRCGFTGFWFKLWCESVVRGCGVDGVGMGGSRGRLRVVIVFDGEFDVVFTAVDIVCGVFEVGAVSFVDPVGGEAVGDLNIDIAAMDLEVCGPEPAIESLLAEVLLEFLTDMFTNMVVIFGVCHSGPLIELRAIVSVKVMRMRNDRACVSPSVDPSVKVV